MALKFLNDGFFDGKVGIGTATPEAKLQVSFNGGHTSGTINIADSSFDIYNPLEANTDEKGSILTFSDNYLDAVGYQRTTRAAIKGGTDTVGNSGNGFLSFYTDSEGANTATERMRIDSAGKVGIGVTSPGATLDVSGSFRLQSGGSTYLSIGSSSGSPYINTGTSGGTVQFGAPASNTTNIQVQGTVRATGGYKSADGTAGITGTFTFVDKASATRSLTIKNGLITAKT